MHVLLLLGLLVPRACAVRRVLRWITRGLAAELGANLFGTGADSFEFAAEGAPGLSGAAIVTGATGGIGAPLCEMLCERGYEVIVAARDQVRGEAIAEDLRSGGGRARFLQLKLSDPRDAVGFAAALRGAGVRRVSLLVNCAGSMGGSCSETLAVNLVAPAALSVALLPMLMEGERPRIVNVGSSSHLRAAAVSPALLSDATPDCSLQAYGQSKLGLMQTSRVLRSCAKPTSLCVHDAHPGIVWTPMLRRQFGPIGEFLRRLGLSQLLFKTPERGAQMVLAAALAAPHHPEDGAPAYFVDGRLSPKLASPESCDEAAAREMWQRVIAPALADAGLRAPLAV